MKQTIFINQQKYTLDPSQLIQSGGEGMVFALGDTAVKRYHQPHHQQKAKLDQLINMHLPNNILAPCATVQDETGLTIGFQMPKLPGNAQPCKRLTNPLFWRKNNIQTQAIIQLFQHIHQDLTQLHYNEIIVGDLNDQNIFFPSPLTHRPAPFWIDSDSYQFAQFPCPVANLTFLDPHLYHVSDFSERPYFTPNTDWYAYFVLLIKSLLQIHPYGGTHTQHKSLQARSQAGLTILDPTVKYPTNARHPETLSDDLLHHLHLIFNQGHRQSFPFDLLSGYANDLTTCNQCNLAYPRQRPSCPTCQHQTPVTQPIGHQLRQLLQIDGFIEHIAVQANGRILIIAQTNGQYKLFRLGIGGTKEEMVLFNGRPGYKCAIFGDGISSQHLVVNPPHSQHLLILDISGDQPQKVTMLETADFRGTAVCATTPQHLYRIAGNWIMRGSIQNGHYLEDALTTAHQAQTQFFGSPYSNIIAGYHRIFAQTNFFLIDQHGASYDIDIPSLPPGASVPETAVTFSRDTVVIIQKVSINGRYTIHTHITNHKGQHSSTHQIPSDNLHPHRHHYPYHQKLPATLPLSDQTILHLHPSGLLLHQPDQSLWFHPKRPRKNTFSVW